jgi:hypothetical protein
MRTGHLVNTGETLALWLYKSAKQDGGAYMSLKHRDTVRGMQGEVIIAPADVAGVVKAMIEGAEILTSRGYYLAGGSSAS